MLFLPMIWSDSKLISRVRMQAVLEMDTRLVQGKIKASIVSLTIRRSRMQYRTDIAWSDVHNPSRLL